MAGRQLAERRHRRLRLIFSLGLLASSSACDKPGLGTGDQLSLVVAPVTSQSQTRGRPSVCGASEVQGCVPGLGRYASVTVKASAQDTGLDVPDDTKVLLTVDQGWLVETPAGAQANCLVDSRPNQLQSSLTDGAAQATWCFGDAGGTATLTATSGSISATAQTAVASVPAAVRVWANPSQVADGGTTSVIASVTDCDGKALASTPVIFVVAEGVVAWEGSSIVVNTSAEGLAELSGVVTSAPARVSAVLVRDPAVTCTTTIGGIP